MPHDPGAPFQSIELSSGPPSATQSCNNDTQNLLPKRSLTPLFFEQDILFSYWYQDPAGTSADSLLMHVLSRGSLLSSDMEGLSQSALTILMSWMFLRNLLRLSSVQTQTGGRKP
jgi:hypothetical protein